MAIMDMVDMVMATMERGKLLLSQDTITMDTAIMEVTDTVIMERERLMLSLATTIMAMDITDMVDGHGYYGKREAVAEPGYYHHGYSHYGGYGHGYYGKREADAEPG